ncbi:MAG: VTT domain-containing protein [bacterium]|nr:VTT domain-containing protein [bacterium]
MTIKSQKHLIVYVAAVALSIVLYIWFVNSPLLEPFIVWTRLNNTSFVVFLFLYKVSAIVYPPIPGIATVASIPFLGWWVAYLIDFAGSMVGSAIAYWLARRYGYSFLSKIFDENTITKIRSIQIRPNREKESIFLLRATLGITIAEAICYGAGLLKVGFKNFLFASALAHLAVGIPIFYLANNLFNFKNVQLTVLLTLAGVFIIWKLKGRYFEVNKKV